MRPLHHAIEAEKRFRRAVDRQLTNDVDGEQMPRLGLLRAQYLGFRIRVLRATVRYGGLWIPDSLNVILSDVLERGDSVVDIGANVGWVTEKASWLVGPRGRVHSFEPSPTTVRLLRRRVAALRLDNVVINQFALGSSEGTAILHEFAENFGGSSSLALGEETAPGQHLARETLVEVQTLDAYLLRARLGAVRLIKMDVQGAEVQVLQGAAKMLSAQRPALFVEVERGASAAFGYGPAELLNTIAALKYEMYSWRNEGLKTVRSEEDIPPNGHDDVICLNPDDPFHVAALARLRALADRRSAFLARACFGAV
jgi:FkbM family methyltransferase